MKKPNSIQILSVFIGISLLAVPLIIGYFNGKKFKEQILENPALVSAKITGFSSAYKRADALNYQFEYNGNVYEKHGNSEGKGDDYQKLYNFIQGRTFPVLIKKENPQKYSKILVVPEDFKEYGLKFPDSLKWILQYIER